MRVHGGCHCGKLAYEADIDPEKVKRAQAFCPECGTRIYASAAVDAPQAFNVRVGTIRERAQLKPRLQLWGRAALPWTQDLGAVERMPTQPPM